MQIGDPLPPLTATGADGSALRLDRLAGRPTVLFFYPKADTPGCTREAQDFSALLPEFASAGATVLGLSRDAPAKLGRFADKRDLTVPLASDEDGAISEAFGVWTEKSLYGRRFMGVERSTFLFDAAGRLVQAWRKVRVPGHVAEVLDAVRARS